MEILTVLKIIREAVSGMSDAADAGLKIELNQKIIDLQTAASDLIQEKSDLIAENSKLKEKIKVLEDQLKQTDSLEFKDGAYWTKDGDGPFCSRCWESDTKKIRVQKDSYYAQMKCPECGNEYMTEEQRKQVTENMRAINSLNDM